MKRKYRYPNREAAEKAAIQAEKQLLAASQALNLILSGTQPDYSDKAVCALTGHVFPYTIKLYGASRMDGGTVIVTFAPEGQRPSSTAYNALDWIDETLRRPADFDYELLALRDIAERLRRYLHSASFDV